MEFCLLNAGEPTHWAKRSFKFLAWPKESQMQKPEGLEISETDI